MALYASKAAIQYHKSKSESESSFFEALRTFLEEKLAQVDFDPTCESSSSDPSSRSSLDLADGFFSEGMTAPHAISNVSNSAQKVSQGQAFR
jgi:hypothetical protein